MFLFPYQYLISVGSANSKEEEDSLIDFVSSKNEESSLIDLMSSSVISTKVEETSKEEDMLGIFCDDTSTSVVKTEDLFDGDAPSSSNDVLNEDTPSGNNDIFGDFDREPSTSTDASTLFDSGPPKEEDPLDIFDNAEDDKKEPVENGTSLNGDDLDLLFSNEPVS
jgi:hypothetical protein